MKIGILGGGQLGRMLGMAAIPLGLQTRFYSDRKENPAARVGEVRYGSYLDMDCLIPFADDLHVATYEFENLPYASVEKLSHLLPVHPNPQALFHTQNRVREKQYCEKLGIPVTRWRAVTSESELQRASETIGFPSILKTQEDGYDGKGQFRLNASSDCAVAWKTIREQPAILESVVHFEHEFSMIGVRNWKGEINLYPPIQNTHRNGILFSSLAPDPDLPIPLVKQAQEAVCDLMGALDYIGVITAEFFYANDTILLNEIAPRVHNSGHWTIEGAKTSQFENHLRAIAGFPLGSTESWGVSAMVNMVGGLATPSPLLKIEGTHIHYYEKAAQAGRKIGHVTICDTELSHLVSKLEIITPIINQAWA